MEAGVKAAAIAAALGAFSPSDSRCCSWPSSCAPPGSDPARPHRRCQTSSNPTGRRSRWDGRHKASIRTAGLTKNFGDLRAVNEIDLDLPGRGPSTSRPVWLPRRTGHLSPRPPAPTAPRTSPTWSSSPTPSSRWRGGWASRAPSRAGDARSCSGALLIAFGGVHAALLFQGSDDPTALIATDTLSRNLGHGCATWNDVTGTTYDLPDVKPSHGFYQERRTSGSWQDTVNPYLETGEAMILGRPSTGIHPGVLTYWTNATTPRPAAGTPCTTGPAPTCRPTARKRLWHGP